MTRAEAIAIAAAISQAHDGCEHCVNGICWVLNREALGWTWELADDDNDPDLVIKDEPHQVAMRLRPKE
jgi:hypothetical protein